MTTDELIETLERLEKNATPGPWESRGLGHISAHVEECYAAEGCAVTTSLTPLLRLPEGREAPNWRRDANIIVYLRNHLPALISALKETKRMREALVEAREAIEEWGSYAGDYFREKHDLAGDLARIDAALQPQGEK